MRIIDRRLLNQDLKDKNIPVRGVRIVTDVKGKDRSTYIPYFEKYVKVQWQSEPSEKHRCNLQKVISLHADHEIDAGLFIEHQGALPKQSTSTKKVAEDDIVYKITNPISDNVLPYLNAYIATGVQISSHRSLSDYSIFEYLSGGDKNAEKNLLTAIENEKIITSLPEAGVTFWEGSNGRSLNAETICRLLSTAILRTRNADFALNLVNKFIMEPYYTIEAIYCFDGFKVETELEILPGKLSIIGSEQLNAFSEYQPLLYRNMNSRTGTAAFVENIRRPKFIFSNKREKKPSYFKVYECIRLLTLFGPSCPSHTLTFNRLKPHILSLKNGSGSYSNSIDERSRYRTPFAPSLNQFEKLHNEYIALNSKTRERVDIALTRLNRALRRNDLTNKAIELGVSLEAILLSGKDEDGVGGEITFRLASRGAWLLGDSMEERKKIFNTLKAAYRLRSKAAHEGTIASKTKGVNKGQEPMHTKYLIEDACKLCSEAISQIIKDGSFPDWTDIVLGGE